MIRTLLVGAVVGVALAIGGVAVAMSALNPSAQDVATEIAAETGTQNGVGTDPLAPPDFYGSR